MGKTRPGQMDARIPKQTAPALDKGPDIREQLSDDGPPQAEIARLLGRSPASYTFAGRQWSLAIDTAPPVA